MQEKRSDLPSSIPDNPSLVKTAHYYSDADGYLWVGYAKKWVRFRTQSSDLTPVFDQLLNGSHSLETFLKDAHTLVPGLSKEHLFQILHTLARNGLLVNGSPVLPSLLETDRDYLERHSRDLEFYALFEKETASRYDYLAHIKSARIVVIGLGGVGSWLSLSLACIGIGELVGVDFDNVELSNLARQILYTPANLGQAKTIASQAFFAQFAPEMQFHPRSIKINGPDDVTPLIRDADFVVLAADWPPRRIGRWVNQACIEAGVPALYMSAGASQVHIGPLVIPGQPGCYECFFLQRRQSEVGFASQESITQRDDWFADPVPALSPIPGLAGHMLSWEVLCALTGIQQPCSVGHILQLDLTTFDTKRFPVVMQPTCPFCATLTENVLPLASCEPTAKSYEEGNDHE